MKNIFLLIGQSIMVGRAPREGVEEIFDPRIWMFREQRWQIAYEPYHYMDQEPNMCELGASFAKTLVDATGKEIGLVPCAWGGSSIFEWVPGRKLYYDAVQAVKAALPDGKIKGILWHQGENDCDVEERYSNYRDRFDRTLPELRKDIGAEDVPLIIGELGEFVAKLAHCPYTPQVQSALHQIAEDYDYIDIVSAKGLTCLEDGVHFDAPSLRELGVRYAQVWQAQAKKMGVTLE